MTRNLSKILPIETTAGHTHQSTLGNLQSTENMVEKEQDYSINEYNQDLSL
jgi:hypothetical protein